MSDTAVLADLDRALAATERIVAGIGPGQDLARATGQPADFPADLAEQSLGALRRQLSPRPEGPAAPFGPEVAVPDDAPAIDRLAGFLGRAV